MAEKVELRVDGLMHGVLRSDLSLEIKRGNKLFCYDLVETLRSGRAVVIVRLLTDHDVKETLSKTD